MDIDYKKQALEAFNTIQTNIGFLGIDQELKRIMVTSSIKGEGKSTVSSNIANSYAFSKKKVLLIDCDMRNPSVHRVLDLPNRKGLAGLIMASRENQDPEEYLIHYGNYFDVLTAGHRPPNPTELLSSSRMGKLLDEFDNDYDYIILDTPPVLIVPDAIALRKYVDGVLLVVRHGYTTKEVLEDCKKAWEVAGTKPNACILNGIPDMQKRYSYYGYYDYEERNTKPGKERKAAKGKMKPEAEKKTAEDASLRSKRHDVRTRIQAEELTEDSIRAEKQEEEFLSVEWERKTDTKRKLR